MTHERAPSQAEMYLSYLVTTRRERKQGILLSKRECQNRFDAGRAKLCESRTHPFVDYERRILNSLRIRLVEIE